MWLGRFIKINIKYLGYLVLFVVDPVILTGLPRIIRFFLYFSPQICKWMSWSESSKDKGVGKYFPGQGSLFDVAKTRSAKATWFDSTHPHVEFKIYSYIENVYSIHHYLHIYVCTIHMQYFVFNKNKKRNPTKK